MQNSVLHFISRGELQRLNHCVQVVCRSPGFIQMFCVCLGCVQCRQCNNALQATVDAFSSSVNDVQLGLCTACAEIARTSKL